MILSIDTTGPMSAAAVFTPTMQAVVQRVASEPLRSEELLRLIHEVTGGELSQLRLIAACIGPGSFTGLRIGLSLALGLSQALAIHAIGVPLLSLGVSRRRSVETVVHSAASATDVWVETFPAENSSIRGTGCTHMSRESLAQFQSKPGTIVVDLDVECPADQRCQRIAEVALEMSRLGERGDLCAVYGKAVNAKTIEERSRLIAPAAIS